MPFLEAALISLRLQKSIFGDEHFNTSASKNIRFLEAVFLKCPPLKTKICLPPLMQGLTEAEFFLSASETLLKVSPKTFFLVVYSCCLLTFLKEVLAQFISPN